MTSLDTPGDLNARRSPIFYTMREKRPPDKEDEDSMRPTSFSKRQKGTSVYTLSSYTLAWICALHVEMAAAEAMLDEKHPALPTPQNDDNNYTLGSIGPHKIVIACLPAAQYGSIEAANVWTNLTRTFPEIRAGLMVGVGGGAPSGRNDIRLGDVVVGTRVMPYELGKLVPGGCVQRTAIWARPHHWLGTLVSKLRSKHELQSNCIPSILQEKLARRPDYQHPGLPDDLFIAQYDHNNSESSDCSRCDQSKMISRPSRESTEPKIYYGGIASGDKVVKDGQARDSLSQKLDAICFEMESAGLMGTLPCLPVRGVCDYSDSHKNKAWQRYAAATAAAYARELLLESPGTALDNHQLESNTENNTPVDHAARRKELIASLHFTRIDSRRTTIEPAYDKTCEWFLQSPQYIQWQDSQQLQDHHGFLWIRGKPGAGKSTLMKHLYTNAKIGDSRAASTDLVSSFFFNARGEHLEKSVWGMYRSLLLQLLEHFVDLQHILDEPDVVPRHQTGCPPVHVLKNILRIMVSRLENRSFTCFIDALDEGDEQQIADMIQCFEDLAKNAARDKIRLRICFSSRHYPYVDVNHCVRVTLEDQTGHTHDMASYVESHLQFSMSRVLRKQLVDKASGVFLWVVLVVDVLNKEFRRGGFALETRLNEIPSGLGDLFKDILIRDGDNKIDLLLCLSWILFSRRPLTPSEFYHAMWSGLAVRGHGLADQCMPNAAATGFDKRAELSVISSSKGLAETTKSEQPVVQFIHESVRDFLIKDHGIAEIWPDFRELQSHENMKQYCAFYLNQKAIGEFLEMSSEPSTKVADEVARQYPFLEYASKHILTHADAAAEHEPQDHFLSSFPRSRWIMVSNALERDWFCHYAKETRLIYILAERGLPKLIRTRLTQESGCERVEAERYKYPLFAAFAAKSCASVYALLGSSSVNPKDFDAASEGFRSLFLHSGYKTFSPLTWAASLGLEAIIHLLIRQGTKVNEADGNGETAFSHARGGRHDHLAEWLFKLGASTNAFKIPKAVTASAERDEEPLRRIMVDFAMTGKTWDHRSNPLCFDIAAAEPTISRFLIECGFDVNNADEKGNTPLHVSAKGGHYSGVKLLVSEGALVNNLNNRGYTPLHLAARKGCRLSVTLLIESGADVDLSGTNGLTPLSLASKHGHYAIANLLIASGASVNIADTRGNTPLCFALMHSEVAIARLLIEDGADINVSNLEGSTPLHIVLNRGLESITKTLIESGANVNITGSGGNTPLCLALMHDQASVARLLIEAGAVINVSNLEGRTPLGIALTRGLESTARTLIESGANINVIAENGDTLLCLAIKYDRQSEARLLIESGADINTTDALGYSPLCLAVVRNHRSLVRLLIESGADSNATNAVEYSPLCLAMAHNRISIARLLVESGPTCVDKVYENGDTALSFALSKKRLWMARMLIENNAEFNITALFVAIEFGDDSFTEFLISKGVDVNQPDERGSAALHKAAEYEREAATGLLLSHGADINASDSFGRTPLHSAARNSMDNIARMLVDHGAGINASDSFGQTPLHFSARNSMDNIARMLIDHGANVDVEDLENRTPLYEAVWSGHPLLVRMLLDHGAKVDVEDLTRITPLHEAAWLGDHPLVEVLIENGAEIEARCAEGHTPLMKAILGCGQDYWLDDVVLISSRTLLEHGANANTRDNNGITPLALAKKYHFEELESLLLEFGATT